MSSLADGVSTTAGFGASLDPLVLSVNGSVHWRSTVDVEVPLITVVLRASGYALPPEVTGTLLSTVTVGGVTLAEGDEVELAFSQCTRLRCVSPSAGDYTVIVQHSRHHDLFTSDGLHDTLDVVFAPGLELASVSVGQGFTVRGDGLGFVLAHPAMLSELRRRAKPDESPMEFLTTSDRADEFLHEGWLLPVLGVKTLWPFRVLITEASLRLPLGARVMGPRVARLAPSDRYVVFGGESLNRMLPARQAVIDLTASGSYAMDVYVSGGELATIVLRPHEDYAHRTIEPLVNVDTHAMWDEQPHEPLVSLR